MLRTRLSVLVLALVVLASCGKDDVQRSPREVVRDVVTRAVTHQSAMLSIVEQHQAEPAEVVVRLERYVSDNRAEIDTLAQQRSLLEKEQLAFAEAWRAEAATLFERRRRLERAVPELMARPEVARALSAFDPL